MPNILESILPFFGGKTVFVTMQDGTEVFPQAKILKAAISPESRPMEHPVESGATITDHRIILPTEIELSLVLSTENYRDIYKQIATLYAQGTILTVQCRAGTFTNQLIQSIPHTEDAEQYNAIIMSLKLKQVLIAITPSTSTVSPGVNANAREAKVIAPTQPQNTSVVDRGTVQGRTPRRSEAQMRADVAIATRNNPTEGRPLRPL